ncbi:MAG: hypothetical protein ACREB9_00855 [Thermoplasmata archaeon]
MPVTISDITRRIRGADSRTNHALGKAFNQGDPQDLRDLLRAIEEEQAELDLARADLKMLIFQTEQEVPRFVAREREAAPPRTFSSTMAGFVAEKNVYGFGMGRAASRPSLPSPRRTEPGDFAHLEHVPSGLTEEERAKLIRAQKESRWKPGH